MGGSKETEGTVEVCYSSFWGLVSVAGWDNKDAAVVCYNLGFERSGMCTYFHYQIIDLFSRCYCFYGFTLW